LGAWPLQALYKLRDKVGNAEYGTVNGNRMNGRVDSGNIGYRVSYNRIGLKERSNKEGRVDGRVI